MQPILIEKPYRFIPPHRGDGWPTLVRDCNLPGMWLRRSEGVVSHEMRSADQFCRSRCGPGMESC